MIAAGVKPLPAETFAKLVEIAKSLRGVARAMDTLPADDVGDTLRDAYRLAAESVEALVESERDLQPGGCIAIMRDAAKTREEK